MKALLQVTLGACLERPEDLCVAFVRRQHNNFRFGKFLADRDDGIQAVHLRHLQVHERDVRPMRTELLYSLAPIGCFGDQSHIGLSVEEYSYALPYENMVVNCENPDLS